MTSHGSFHCFNTKRAQQFSNSSFVCTHCAPVINDPTLTRPSHQATTHTLLLQVSSGFCSTPIQTPDLTLSGLLVFHPHNWAYTQKFCPLQPRSRPYQSLEANHRLFVTPSTRMRPSSTHLTSGPAYHLTNQISQCYATPISLAPYSPIILFPIHAFSIPLGPSPHQRARLRPKEQHPLLRNLQSQTSIYSMPRPICFSTHQS